MEMEIEDPGGPPSSAVGKERIESSSREKPNEEEPVTKKKMGNG